MSIYEIAALTTAVCWALSSTISARPARHLGAIGFNRARMWIVALVLGAYIFIGGQWQSVGSSHLLPIFLSGFIGILSGDTLLYLALNRVGPRRTAVLYSANAPFTTIMGWTILGEELSLEVLTGIALVFLGVVLAIVFGKRRSQLHEWEQVKGPLWVGVSLALLAALCQATGSIIIRPVMEAEVPPVAVAAGRCFVAAIGLSVLMLLPNPRFKLQNPMTLPIFGRAAASALLAMGLGMTLLLFALEGEDVGIVSSLTATTPVLLLPILWITTRERPAIGAWIGALLVVVGCVLMFS
ncbi:DMT family transporter [Flexibacterium corallicola]|uniref:DMT family transporter n=1 Tax=Flexibacterium corallicola TaxID=3037259 RepID=UPI00286F146B|nr:DMT family transporter [Pseudovibrio sp. M1P-2-3]